MATLGESVELFFIKHLVTLVGRYIICDKIQSKIDISIMGLFDHPNHLVRDLLLCYVKINNTLTCLIESKSYSISLYQI